MSIVNNLGGIWEKLSSVAKFAARYADEMSNVAAAFRVIVPSLPINSKDKATVANAVSALEQIAGNIESALTANPEFGAKVEIRRSDLVEIVADLLPGIVTDMLPVIVAEEMAKSAGGKG